MIRIAQKVRIVCGACFLVFALTAQTGNYKNIVFDLGGVILNGGHDYSVQKGEEDASDLRCIKVCGSTTWRNWHRGRLSKEALIKRLTQSFDQKAVEQLVAEAISPDRTWIEESIDVIKRLKKAGYRVYLLSNLSREAHDVYLNLNDIFSQFDGMIFSFEVGYVKPDPKIYRLLLKTYGLTASETLFIDDKKVNIDAAQRIGIAGIVYDKGLLEKNLLKRGVLIPQR
ncbi:MAG: HAD-superfamily hydrolase [candidate division TM6 bacterium GW2011_GWE2_42_60]|nr:MAG: HAD-superfamily hydrolase [candidate division TM6 bacterium GW2011_GWE2_42_60]HBY05750.1 hypothetical protein [Candidatus Dependentiae bacterium]